VNQELIQFILDHEHDDIGKLLLKHKEILGFPASFVADQINGRKRAKEKLPTWYAHPSIIYPPQQNLEQCSSEITASFKCDFIVRASSKGHIRNEALIDLTGGFGIDTFCFSRIFNRVVHVEPDDKLSHMAEENFKALGVTNVVCTQQTATDFLATLHEQADWIYLDPSRKSNGKKLVKLSDCQPDVIQLLHALWSKTNQILIKASPLIDIKEGIRQLSQTAHVLIVSVNNECKEVLFHLRKDFTEEPTIEAINIQDNKQDSFSFRFSTEENVSSNFSTPLNFLYEPNVSILKGGAFKTIGVEFGLKKIALNTHFYTSEKPVDKFPGRIFSVLGDISEHSVLLPTRCANVISRNHPLTPEEIKKKFKLKDGGDRYVLAFSGEQKKYILIAERIQ
jgi:16S rRNA G966 N2-methylase RsmD